MKQVINMEVTKISTHLQRERERRICRGIQPWGFRILY